MTVTLADFQEGDTMKDERFFISAVEMKETRTKKPYADLTLKYQDGSEINGKIWSNNLDDKVRLQRGMVIVLTAKVDKYKTTKQLDIQSYKVEEAKEEDVFQSPLDPDEIDAMCKEMFETEFENNQIRSVIEELANTPINHFPEKFKKWSPAMLVHHAYPGGLVQHTYEVYSTAKYLGRDLFKGQIDGDLLIAGAILHDIGNVHSLDFDGDFVPNRQGRLLGHVYIGAEMTASICGLCEVDMELQEKLVHIVLSHMGKLEWGSPVLPKFIEAKLVHYCDTISAGVRSFERIIKNAEDDGTGFTYDRTIGEVML